MFWKAYRKYIKSEINRMRQVSVSQFKQIFFKGEEKLCSFEEIITAILTDSSIIFLIKKNLGKMRRRERMELKPYLIK